MNEINAPILTDFGIAKLLEGVNGHTLTASGVGIGTPEYMAPEQGMGASTIDARADIYSLGIVLYEMVTGRKPYIADTPMAVVLKQMTDPLPRPCDIVPDLPEDVENILFKALAKKPEDRFEDMNAFIAAMEGVLAEKQKVEVSAPAKRVKKRAEPRAKFSPKVAMAVAGALTVILVIAFGRSWIIKRFSTESEAGATPTKVSDKPSSTFTLFSSTKTLEPSPSSTLTRTPRPTRTNTALPSWVTNFAEPILAAIKDRKPDFQDDFSTDTKRWYLNSLGVTGRDWIKAVLIDKGVMRLQGEFSVSNYYFLYKPNIVLQVDILPPITSTVAVSLTSPPFEGDPDKIQLDPNNEWSVRHIPDSIAIASGTYNGGQKTQIMVIVKDSQVAFYINGVPVAYQEIPILSDYKKSERQFGCSGTCYFDNVKFWNLDNIPNLP